MMRMSEVSSNLYTVVICFMLWTVAYFSWGYQAGLASMSDLSTVLPLYVVSWIVLIGLVYSTAR